MSILTATLLVLSYGALNTDAPATPALPAPPPAKTERAEASHDPIICERSTEIGSRLKRRKVCMHRSEWDRQRLENKQMIDRTQVLRGVTPGG